MRSMIVGLSIFLFAGEALAQARCYFANGTVLPNIPEYNEYQPCSGIGSICCGTNRDNPAGGNSSNGFTADECLPNGLCQNRITADGVERTSWWADFCSDSDINSGNCLNICDQVRNSFGNTPLTPCNGRADSERWCCGDSNACCTSNVGVVRLAQVFGGVLSSSIVSSATPTTSLASSIGATSATASTSGTGSSSSSPSSSSSTTPGQGGGDSGLSSGAIAGIVIGVVAGLALLAAAIFFWRRSAKYKKQALGPQYAEAPGGYPGGYRDQEPAAVPVEKYGKQQAGTAGSPPIELPPAPPSELPSGDYTQYAGQHPQK